MYQNTRDHSIPQSSNQTRYMIIPFLKPSKVKETSNPKKDHLMKDQLILDEITPLTKQASSELRAIYLILLRSARYSQCASV
uniref:Uncharacterized protein n=1 Tax=Arundo donax TaxID=35708 RepID=A0A0A8YTW8_ARUDO